MEQVTRPEALAEVERATLRAMKAQVDGLREGYHRVARFTPGDGRPKLWMDVREERQGIMVFVHAGAVMYAEDVTAPGGVARRLEMFDHAVVMEPRDQDVRDLLRQAVMRSGPVEVWFLRTRPFGSELVRGLRPPWNVATRV